MKLNKSSLPVRDKGFNAGGDLDRHIQDKHTESECPMCDKKFTSRKQAHEHICMVGEIVPQICSKFECKKEFTSSAALANHTNNHTLVIKKMCAQNAAKYLTKA